MRPITAWAGLIAEAQATPRFAQPRRQLRQNLGTVLENPELADLAAAATLRNRHSDRRLVHIQPDISDSIHQALLPCMRLCAGHPAQPSTFCMPRGGPPITHRTSGLRRAHGLAAHADAAGVLGPMEERCGTTRGAVAECHRARQHEPCHVAKRVERLTPDRVPGSSLAAGSTYA